MNMSHHHQAGVASLWTVMLFVVLFAFITLAIDTGYKVLVASQLNAGADAAALAGAAWLRRDMDQARLEAVDYAAANTAGSESIQIDLNEANAVDGDIVLGHYSRDRRTFSPGLSNVNAIQVLAPRTDESVGGPLALLFGPIFGVDTAEVARRATAIIGGDVGAGVIALNPTAPCALDLRGTPSLLSVDGGAVYVNSSSTNAACNAGQPQLEAVEVYVHGEASSSFDSQVRFDGEVYEGVDPVPDPLAGLPAPSYSGLTDQGSIKITGNKEEQHGPGYYSGGIEVRNGRLVLDPGVYILGGNGLDVNGGDLIANGVMFYIVDDGYVDLRGNGEIEITAMDPLVYPDGPTLSSEYTDVRVAIFQARDNTNANRILGTNDFTVSGTVYLPAAHLEVGGTSQSLASGLIADTFQFHGDGELRINYDDRFPRIPRFVYLVK